MPEYSSFHETVKRLRPDQHVDSNTFWVGVLPPDKRPADVKEHADMLWIKAREKISVAKIKTAFCAAKRLDGQNIALIEGGIFLTETTRVGALDRFNDKIVAIEAVNKADLRTRLPDLNTRGVLRDTSNTRLTPKPASADKFVKPTSFPSMGANKSSPVLESSPAPSSTSRSPAPSETPSWAQAFGAGRRGMHTSSPSPWPSSPSSLVTTQSERSDTPLYHPDAEDRTLMAFTDFSCERREIAKSTRQDLRGTSNHIHREWLQLGSEAKTFFLDRSAKIISSAARLPNIPPALHLSCHFRGFWTFYFARLAVGLSQGLQPHLNLSSRDHFFAQILHDWDLAPVNVRMNYIKPNVSEIEKNPIVLPETMREWLQAGPAPKAEPVEEPILPSMTSVAARADVVKSEADAVPAEAPPMFNIPDLFANCSPEELERGVQQGISLLDKIGASLSSQDQQQDVAHWLQNIRNVAKQAERSKTIVGVVGNTGAGKSSVINALLDEERLVPTNCMRACTAVVTEISYNNEEEPYRAEIEFINADAWQNELKVLFQDLLDGNGGISRECTNEDTEAGIAYAKIKAVYPKLTKEDMAKSTVDTLMKHENVSRLLGKSRDFASSESLTFYKTLQSYVDSKEKSTGLKGKDKDKQKSPPREMEYWPLIRVVRLYVKADALSTGAVIVDLPGVHDSNQARAAVAEGYMKQCTGLWIVAPITRAVDDKSAKSLLGESFKRQLKMDGGFSTITFICSKTDDISLIEAQDSLGLEEEMGSLWEQSDALAKQKKNHQKEIESLKETKADFNAALETADEDLEVWEKLRDDLSDGVTVYAPESGETKKRKRGSSSPKGSEKRQRRMSDASSDRDFIDDGSDAEEASDNDEDGDGDGDRGAPLTQEDIENKITELKTVKKDGRREKTKLDESIKELRKEITVIQEKKDKIDAEMSAICISGRNQYSKGAIQQDFAAGIKELDQEIAEEQDAANFNPDVDVRDYDEVAKGLPVFCVSSRGYQKLQGRLRKDPPVPGFEHVDETEMPQLQAHCKKLTEAGRDATCRRFLNSLSQLLNSLRLWSSSNGSGVNLTVGQRAREAQILEDKLRKLDKELEDSIKGVCSTVTEELQDQIYDHFETAVENAINEAMLTVEKWSAPVNRDNRAAGGFFWATYKAICRRDGVYSNAQGLHDFNAQLTDPILKFCAPRWERCFTRRVPTIMTSLAATAGKALEKFHKAVEERATRNGTSIAAFQVLKQQLETYKQTFKDIATGGRDEILTIQKDVNRDFVPAVAAGMQSAYDGCVYESGPGSYMRMKALMRQHVDDEKGNMFRTSTSNVRDRLKKMVTAAEENMLAKADVVFLAVKRDYTSAVLGQDNATSSKGLLPREQRMMRSQIIEIVESSESAFKKVLGLVEEDEDEEEKPVVSGDISTETPKSEPPSEDDFHECEDHDLDSKAEDSTTSAAPTALAEKDNNTLMQPRQSTEIKRVSDAMQLDDENIMPVVKAETETA